jgi:hypothetical protein
MSNLRKALVLLAVLALCGALSASAAPVVPVGSVLAVGIGYGPQVGVFADGGFVVVWNASNALRARFFDANGAAKSGALQLVRPAGQILDSVAALPTGGFVAVWDQKNPTGTYEVLARVFDRNGGFVSAPFKVHGVSPSSRCCALVAAAPGGGFAIEWTAYGGNGIYPSLFYSRVLYRFFDPVGRPLGTAPVDPPLQDIPDLGDTFVDAVVVAPDGALADVWLDEADDVELDWDRGHTGIAGVFQTSARDDADGYGADFASIAAAILPEAGFVLSWTSGSPLPFTPPISSIFTQRFDAQGKAIGSRPVKASLENGWAIHPVLALLPDGGFVTVWNQLPSRAASGVGVLHGRTFSAAGTPVTAEFRLGTKPAGDQSPAALAAGANGEVVAAWGQVDAQGVGQVYARLLKAP